MTMRLWVNRDFSVRAALCLAAFTVVPAAARTHPATAVAHPAAKAHGNVHAAAPHSAPSRQATASHPAHKAVAHEAGAHTASRRHAVAQEAPEPRSRAHGKATKHREAEPAERRGKRKGKAATKAQRSTKSRKLRPEEEADGEPLTQYRADARGRKPERTLAPHTPPPAARVASREAPATEPEAEPAPADSAALPPGRTHDRRSLRAKGLLTPSAASPTRSTDTSAKPPTETFERGESHPDQDIRVDMSQPPDRVPAVRAQLAAAAAANTAVVTATPEPVTSAGKATVPEKLHSMAVRAETVLKADAEAAKAKVEKRPAPAKSSFALPEDPAEKDAVIAAAMTPRVLPNMYTPGGRLIVPPPMRGSRDILVHQNIMADKDGLDRIQDDADLNRLRAAHLLVPVESTDALEVNSELPENRRYARPWTVRFVNDTARAYYARFGTALRLNSAVRTVSYQLRLQRVNGNAAAVDGDGASPHLTGQAIDFGKRGMSVAEIAWMRAYLGPLMDAGKIDVEEEFQQACFHVSVYRSYAPAAKPKARAKPEVDIAQTREPQLPAMPQTHAAPIVRVSAKPEESNDDVQ